MMETFDKNNDMQSLALEYYIKHFLSLSRNDERNALLALSKISENILAVMTAIFTYMIKSRKNADTELSKLRCCMIQYMAGKHLAVHNLITSQPIILINKKKNIINDYTPAVSIVRSMFELLLCYQSLYFTPKTQEEQTFLFNIWKYKGLTFPATKNKNNHSLTHISNQKRDELKREIELSPLYDGKEFKAAINNSIFYIHGKTNNRHLVSCSFSRGWNMLRDADIIKGNVIENLYSSMCEETHITYFGLMMYEQQNDIKPSPRLKSLYLSCAFFCCMLVGIIIQDKNYRKVFSRLEPIQQQIIRTFSEVFYNRRYNI